ncbi:MAG: sigma-70 family RNA polymerase sigma factor [Steroidobacteraceae bacterium]
MAANEKDIAAADLRSRLDSRFHGPLMSFFLRRMQHHADAEDLTQETLLRVIAAQASTHVEHAESYVFAIAANLLKDHRRKSHRFDPEACIPIEDAVASELEAQLVEDLSPEKVLLTKDSLKEALSILDELGERTRDIFVLFRLENMKQKDIARAFGIGQSTVEKHVMRAVLHLAARQGGKKK